jgi:hypothetical protein
VGSHYQSQKVAQNFAGQAPINKPYCGSQGSLHLLTDSTGILAFSRLLLLDFNKPAHGPSNEFSFADDPL